MIKNIFIAVILFFAFIGFINFAKVNSEVYAGAQKRISNTSFGKMTTETVDAVKKHHWKFIQK